MAKIGDLEVDELHIELGAVSDTSEVIGSTSLSATIPAPASASGVVLTQVISNPSGAPLLIGFDFYVSTSHTGGVFTSTSEYRITRPSFTVASVPWTGGPGNYALNGAIHDPSPPAGNTTYTLTAYLTNNGFINGMKVDAYFIDAVLQFRWMFK